MMVVDLNAVVSLLARNDFNVLNTSVLMALAVIILLLMAFSCLVVLATLTAVTLVLPNFFALFNLIALLALLVGRISVAGYGLAI